MDQRGRTAGASEGTESHQSCKNWERETRDDGDGAKRGGRGCGGEDESGASRTEGFRQ